MFAGGVRFHTAVSCIFNTVVVVACVIFIHCFSRCDVVDIGSEHFVVYLSCV